MGFIQNKNVVAAELDSEICIFNPENGEYVNLNETGSYIWHLIEEMQNVEMLLTNLHKEYEGEKAIIKSNLIEFLNEGIKNGFINKLN